MKSQTITLFRVLSIVYALLVLIISSWPGIKLPDLGIDWTDKLAHFGQYAILAFLVAGGWARPGGWRTWAGQWHPLLILLVFSALDEWHQIWIPRREASAVDWVADAIGIVVGFGLGVLLWRRERT